MPQFEYVYLGSKHNAFCVPQAAYHQVVALVNANKLCLADYRERHPYSNTNPCVGRGICLEHFLARHSHLTRLDKVEQNTEGENIYFFLDQYGYVYTSTEDSTEEAEVKRDTFRTLRHYGYITPDKVESRGKVVDFYSYYATLYGNLRTASVIVLSYHHYAEKVKGLFLLYKNGPCTPLTKKAEVYTKASAIVESTKDAQGEYHINGNDHTGFYEADVYEVISQLETAVYEVTRRLQNAALTKSEEAMHG